MRRSSARARDPGRRPGGRPTGPAADAAKPIKAADHHRRQRRRPRLEGDHPGPPGHPLAPGRIKVDVTTTPAKDLTDENLAKYDVLLLNYKDTPRTAPRTRSGPTRTRRRSSRRSRGARGWSSTTTPRPPSPSRTGRSSRRRSPAAGGPRASTARRTSSRSRRPPSSTRSPRACPPSSTTSIDELYSDLACAPAAASCWPPPTADPAKPQGDRQGRGRRSGSTSTARAGSSRTSSATTPRRWPTRTSRTGCARGVEWAATGKVGVERRSDVDDREPDRPHRRDLAPVGRRASPRSSSPEPMAMPPSGQRDYSAVRLTRHALERFVERFGGEPDEAEAVAPGRAGADAAARPQPRQRRRRRPGRPPRPRPGRHPPGGDLPDRPDLAPVRPPPRRVRPPPPPPQVGPAPPPPHRPRAADPEPSRRAERSATPSVE